MLPFPAVRILFDYRSALRQRTGVGEYAHELAVALDHASAETRDTVVLFTASWRDRIDPAALAAMPHVTVVDRALPAAALTRAWNRWEWPPIEWLAGPADVVHAHTPLLIPASRAAQVVTIHDLYFLAHPETTEAEIRRDYAPLVSAHARRAHQVIVSSRSARDQVARVLGIARARISVCSPGAPHWAASVRRRRHTAGCGSSILFVGTLEPRKNLDGLLEAYAAVVSERPDAPPLVLAGQIKASMRPLLARLTQPPLAGRVTVTGYVDEPAKRELYVGARILVLPSFDEGFGLPVLEAMACGVPVVVSDRGSLPEVAAGAARPIDPDDTMALAREMLRLLDATAHAEAVDHGLRVAATYRWEACAAAAREAYAAALDEQARRGR